MTAAETEGVTIPAVFCHVAWCDLHKIARASRAHVSEPLTADFVSHLHCFAFTMMSARRTMCALRILARQAAFRIILAILIPIIRQIIFPRSNVGRTRVQKPCYLTHRSIEQANGPTGACRENHHERPLLKSLSVNIIQCKFCVSDISLQWSHFKGLLAFLLLLLVLLFLLLLFFLLLLVPN